MLKAEGRVVDFEFQLINGKRGVRDCLTSLNLYPEEGILDGSILDITERKRQEKEIVSANEEWKRTFDSVSDLIALLDVKHRIKRVNKAMAARFGSTPEQLVGRRCYEVVHGTSAPPDYCPHSRLLRSGKEEGSEFSDTRDGSLFEVRTTPVYDETGRLVGSVHIMRDITEHRKLEEHLRQSQKLEGIGQLAGGIAHDFNNVLSAIVGFAGLLQMKMDRSDPLAHYANQIMAAGLRGAAMTQQILAFSRKQVLNMRPVNLHEIVMGLEKMLHRLVREDIDIQYNLANKNLVIFADINQISQILINLVANARDAMPSGGRLSIAMEAFVMDREYIEMHGYGSPGEYAVLTISDTGCGMDAKTRSHIFEPFFTTKESGKGTGLGLAVVHGIVKQHNGYINVYSEVGKGTSFKIYLPLTEQAEEEAESKPDDLLIRGGTETILIAEDDDSLRALLKAVLSHHGYKVIEAADGEDAVRKFEVYKDDIKLVILDGIMPNKNGKEAYDDILKFCPDMKAIFMSGYAEDIFPSGGLTEKNTVFIQKPLTPSDLIRKVRAALDQ
ncbi:MAG: ATP-binding protein [Thermodesulfovibrionales bacterium]